MAAPLRAPPIREQRGDAALPGADRLVAALAAALEEPLGDVPDAALIAETPAHGEPHDGGRVLEIGERGAGPLVEPPPTGPAAEPPGAERGAPLPLRRGRGCPVGTRQPRPLTIPRMRLAKASEPCVLTEPWDGVSLQPESLERRDVAGAMCLHLRRKSGSL